MSFKILSLIAWFWISVTRLDEKTLFAASLYSLSNAIPLIEFVLSADILVKYRNQLVQKLWILKSNINDNQQKIDHLYSLTYIESHSIVVKFIEKQVSIMNAAIFILTFVLAKLFTYQLL